jgi:N-methylhydantoinase A
VCLSRSATRSSRNIVSTSASRRRRSTPTSGPKTASYLGRLSKGLYAIGVTADLRLMQSAGGAATLDAALRRPVTLLMSGPVGGLLGGIFVGQLAGFESVVTLDVGGTSADIGVAPGGQMLFKHMLDTRLGDYHAMVPMAEVDAIGAGGGSIAYVDSGGQFQVGPRSAGSEPGPCCYGRGGVEPTATDCMVALGYLDPASFLGGRLPLDAQLSLGAIQNRLSGPLGTNVEEAALGAIKILTHNMVQAIEINSVRRGYDPRDFALVAFGGGGPLFACDIARELGIPNVVVPPLPGLTSALGLLTTDVAYEQGTTVMQLLSAIDLVRLAARFQELEADIRAQLMRDGFDVGQISFVRSADCRYLGQGHELRTPAPAGLVDVNFVHQLRDAFDRQHDRAYGHIYTGRDLEIVNIRVVGVGAVSRLRVKPIAQGVATPPEKAMTGRYRTVFGIDGGTKAIDTPRYARALLEPGNRIEGPAVIDQMDATTLIPPSFAGQIDRFGNLVIAAT